MEVTQHGEAKATRIITFPKRRGHSMQGHEEKHKVWSKVRRNEGKAKPSD